MASSTDNPATTTPLPGVAAAEGIVIVDVGPDASRFYVHKALLAHHSEYFRKALNGPWKETQERLVTLEDVEPRIFALFVHWLYTQQFPQEREDWERMLYVAEYQYLCDEGLRVYAAGYVLGDRLLASTFSRATNNEFQTKFGGTYFADYSGRLAVSFAFTTLRPGCVLLQRLVDEYCDGGIEEGDFTLEAQVEMPRAFLWRVTQRFQELSVMSDEEKEDERRCYLEHASEGEEAECKEQHMRYDEEFGTAYFE